MFKFKKKDKNPDKDKSSAKDKKPAAESPKDEKTDEKPAKRSFFKKLFSFKFIIIFLILIVIIGAAAFAGWFFFLKKHNIDNPTKIEETATKDGKDGKKNLPPPGPDFPDIVDLEPFEKIMMQDSEPMSYLTLKISIELIKPEMRKDIESNNDKIRHIVEAEIKKMKWLVLRSPDGKINFKYRLIKELNGALPSSMIQNIYFTRFLLQ